MPWTSLRFVSSSGMMPLVNQPAFVVSDPVSQIRQSNPVIAILAVDNSCLPLTHSFGRSTPRITARTHEFYIVNKTSVCGLRFRRRQRRSFFSQVEVVDSEIHAGARWYAFDWKTLLCTKFMSDIQAWYFVPGAATAPICTCECMPEG